MANEFHLSDRELLMQLDGELAARDAARVESHLSSCWTCRTRRQDLESTIGDFVHYYQSSALPAEAAAASDGPRALLRAQLEQLSAEEKHPAWRRWLGWNARWAAAAGALVIAGLAAFFSLPVYSYRVLAVPNPSLTPGATVLRSSQELCREEGVKNKAVPAALQKVVFAEYGIRSFHRGAYEVDYLITPALGGAEDIHNLWPQSSEATVWNSQVKDALEDRLRTLVCGGQVDLATAQREIAGNWIEAYKKYFRTDQPVQKKH